MHSRRTLCLLCGVLILVARCQPDPDPDADAHDPPPYEEEPVSQEVSIPGGEEPEGQYEGDDGVMFATLTSEQMHAMFAKIDADKDGKVSKEEVDKFAEVTEKTIANRDIAITMEDVDKDKDGRVSLQEVLDLHFDEDPNERALERKLHTEKFKAADQDKSGALDAEEYLTFYYPMYHDGVLNVIAEVTMKHKDKDGDGELTPAEFWPSGGDDGNHAQEADGTSPDSDIHTEGATFARLDADHNGKLNLQELKSWESGGFHTKEALTNLFETADADHDKVITAEEFDGARDALLGSDAHNHLVSWAEHSEL